MSKSHTSIAQVLLAIAIGFRGVACVEPVYCNQWNLPDYDACDTIMNANQIDDYPVGYAFPNTGGCFYLGPPRDIDPDSLNCNIAICFDEGTTAVTPSSLGPAYSFIKTVCTTDYPDPAGGDHHDANYGITMSVTNNPYYNPPAKRSIGEKQSSRAKRLDRRDGICTDGTGTYHLFSSSQYISRPSKRQFITELPAGSSYVIQNSDTKSYTVETSVSVETGFFDLFSSTVGVSVSAGDSVTSTTGQTVNVDCAPGQNGVVYSDPVYTAYLGWCSSNNNAEIDVYVPEKIQNRYTIECLG